MKGSDWVWIIFLALYAVFIWMRDLAWIPGAEDTLPILSAIPLFVWLGWPWKFQNDSKPLSALLLGIAIVLFLAGVISSLTFVFTLSWLLLLWTWLNSRIAPEQQDTLNKLIILPLFAFPWITLDFMNIGWWFRLSGAWVVGSLYRLFGQEVVQEGTNILINKVPFSVEVACAGLNTLQSMIIAGIAIAYLLLGNSKKYWFNLPLLVLYSWIANTLRIFVLVTVALIFGAEFASGPFHYVGGWLVIIFMFLLCWFTFSAQEGKSS